jgi:hypothetical protein
MKGITIKWGHEFQGVQVSKSDSSKWELKCNPSLDSPILFNVLIGADGERSHVVKVSS